MTRAMLRLKPAASAEAERRRVTGAMRGYGGWSRSFGFGCRAAPVITDRALWRTGQALRSLVSNDEGDVTIHAGAKSLPPAVGSAIRRPDALTRSLLYADSCESLRLW
jgi:hypothetical protein